MFIKEVYKSAFTKKEKNMLRVFWKDKIRKVARVDDWA